MKIVHTVGASGVLINLFIEFDDDDAAANLCVTVDLARMFSIESTDAFVDLLIAHSFISFYIFSISL